jgi:hypothetical protein
MRGATSTPTIRMAWFSVKAQEQFYIYILLIYSNFTQFTIINTWGCPYWTVYVKHPLALFTWANSIYIVPVFNLTRSESCAATSRRNQIFIFWKTNQKHCIFWITPYRHTTFLTIRGTRYEHQIYLFWWRHSTVDSVDLNRILDICLISKAK